MTLHHIPASASYPGMTHAAINGKRYAMLGIWTAAQVRRALGSPA